MNTYLYPYFNGENCSIKKVMARNFEECQNKIMEYFIDRFNNLDDTMNFDDFIYDLYEKYDIFIGDIFEINEFL
jgi:hypothetical protein|nr:MAG TPA: hypothetical protein [Bacteriophage sp.]